MDLLPLHAFDLADTPKDRVSLDGSWRTAVLGHRV